jgi:hypothetical protein
LTATKKATTEKPFPFKVSKVIYSNVNPAKTTTVTLEIGTWTDGKFKGQEWYNFSKLTQLKNYTNRKTIMVSKAMGDQIFKGA